MARDDYDRGRRDEAGVGPYLREGVRLVPLRELGDWDLADGEPDIRGWEVRTLGGRVLGEVDELLIDRDEGEVVMLDIDLAGSSRKTLAPLRAVQLDREDRIVRIDTADLEQEELPAIDRADVSEEDARTFSERYGRAYGSHGWNEQRDYVVGRGEHDLHFKGRKDDRAREVAATDREVPIEREASDSDTSRAERRARYSGGEQVIERRPVVVEEVVVRRRVVDEEQREDAATAARPEREDEERRSP